MIIHRVEYSLYLSIVERISESLLVVVMSHPVVALLVLFSTIGTGNSQLELYYVSVTV